MVEAESTTAGAGAGGACTMAWAAVWPTRGDLSGRVTEDITEQIRYFLKMQ